MVALSQPVRFSPVVESGLRLTPLSIAVLVVAALAIPGTPVNPTAAAPAINVRRALYTESGVISDVAGSLPNCRNRAIRGFMRVTVLGLGLVVGLAANVRPVMHTRREDNSFPQIVETKISLHGVRKEFVCQRLAGDETSVIVLFIAPKDMTVADIQLPAGTVTFGHFWAHRPYNVYHWMTPEGQTLGHYFNICDQTHIEPTTLQWRDLVLDVLCRPAASPEVLDEDDLPADLALAMRNTIYEGLKAALAALPDLLGELESKATALWPDVFAAHRLKAKELR